MAAGHWGLLTEFPVGAGARGEDGMLGWLMRLGSFQVWRGSMKRGTGLIGESWERPLSCGGRIQADDEDNASASAKR